jgi:hypothetical protein
VALLLAAALAVSGADVTVRTSQRAVLLATLNVTCQHCDWASAGREAVMLRLTVDGRYSQHLPIVRAGSSDYRVLLGTVESGTHRVSAALDRQRSALELRDDDVITVRIGNVETVDASDTRFQALSLAPFVYQRANTVGQFSDVPVFMWYEIEPTARGTRYRYTVVFTNEDGGTPADRLMATWGRTTDIEYVYSVEIDDSGRILAQDFQGPEHEVLPYRAALEGRHARLWVVTDNNMVLDRGTTDVRFAPAPMHVPLGGVSREQVMDAHPWMYAVASQELVRENKIVANAPPRQGTIPDPRRYVYLEGCGTVGNNALTFAVKVGNTWLSSDRGVPEYRIARDGCFRGAIPLPAQASGRDIEAVRVQAFARPDNPAAAPVRFTHLNTMFMLDEQFVPGPRLFEWRGAAELRAGGPALDLPVK